MRARLIPVLVFAFLFASCGGDEGFFSTLTSGTTSSLPTTTALEETTITTAPMETTTTTVPPVTAWDWVRLEDAVFGMEADRVQFVQSMALGGPGLVAVGGNEAEGDFDAAVWTSPDGLAWSRAAHDEGVFGGPGTQGMAAVAAAGPGLVAVGADSSGDDVDVAVWVSSDGMTWSRVAQDEEALVVPDDQWATTMAATGFGLVAAGWEGLGEDSDAAVWVSADGLAWSRVGHDEAPFGGPGIQEIDGVVVIDGLVVAVGSDESGADGSAAVWTSPDGLTWSRVPHDEAIFGGPGNQVMLAVAAGGPGLVAVGLEWSADRAIAAVWTSPDGLAWSRVPHDEAVFGAAESQVMEGVVVAGGGLVAFGWQTMEEEMDAAVWVSTDGVAWSRSALLSAALGGPDDQMMLHAIEAGPGLVVVGEQHGSGVSDGVVWVATPAG